MPILICRAGIRAISSVVERFLHTEEAAGSIPASPIRFYSKVKGVVMAVAEKRIFRIEIDERLCKGCSLCVDFCPTNVLTMDGNLVVVKELDACNGCQLCDNRCPDFAIQVFEE